MIFMVIGGFMVGCMIGFITAAICAAANEDFGGRGGKNDDE